MSDQIESEGGEEIERTIYLGLEKVPLILNSPQDLEDWVDGEVSQWSWITGSGVERLILPKNMVGYGCCFYCPRRPGNGAGSQF